MLVLLGMAVQTTHMPKNFLFDFGAVLLDLDLNATLEAMRPLLGANYFFDYERNAFPRIFEQYEVGAVTEAEFFAELQRLAVTGTTVRQLRAAWNAMLGPVPLVRLRMLETLRETHGVYLLSNTNATHLTRVYEAFAQRGIYDWDERYFDRTYYSHLIRARKPDAAAYAFVLHDANIRAADTLFIDDNPANIEAARRLGFRTHLHNDGREVATVVKNFLEK